ncbi:MAG: anion permease [Clostridia bacterium]|nr:anion permease [Clostridia bacterium]
MSDHLIICLALFVLTCAGYIANIWSLATVAMASVAALSLTGCLPQKEILACFANDIVIMIGAMSVVAVGFNKTRLCSGLAVGITRIVKGDRNRILLLYCVLAMLLSQIVQSPIIVYGIVAPFCMATADSTGIPRSKIALPLGVVAIATCSTLPVGTGATQAAELSGYISAYYGKLESFTGAIPALGFFDPMIARLPMLIFTVLYCTFVMPRFCPDRVPDRAAQATDGSADQTHLSAFSEIAGIVIFFGTALALMLQASVMKGVAIWQICLTSAVLMVICGVLRPDEAARSVPLSMLLLIVGALAMSGALSATGAGDLIGGFIADIAVRFNNNYVIGLVFYLFPFLCAQFMSNRGAMLIFFPIAIASCHRIGGDPRGLLLLIETGVLAAFMTPMPTAVVPFMMAYGGYDQRDLFRGGWLFIVLGCVVCVGWIMSVMPVF